LKDDVREYMERRRRMDSRREAHTEAETKSEEQSENKIIKSSALTTYSMDLLLKPQRACVGPITWRSIPCAPTSVKTLVVNVFIQRDPRAPVMPFWGDGGPMCVVAQLYQSLNRFLHSGPSFGLKGDRTLEQPLVLQNLNVRVHRPEKLVDGERSLRKNGRPQERDEEDNEEELRTARDCTGAARQFGSLFSHLGRNGLLFDVCKRYSVRSVGAEESLEDKPTPMSRL
jgi:hypothetical protein